MTGVEVAEVIVAAVANAVGAKAVAGAVCVVQCAVCVVRSAVRVMERQGGEAECSARGAVEAWCVV